MRKTALVLALALTFALSTVACASPGKTTETSSAESNLASQESASSAAGEQGVTRQPDAMDDGQVSDEEAGEMRMSIGGADVVVEWENNQAVADLHALAAEGPVTVELSMYGGFEQVGPLGASLTMSDVQMTTEPGDIVLYAGNQISVFYGPNSWAYTKLGHITDRTAGEMADLLGNGDTSITIAIR